MFNSIFTDFPTGLHLDATAAQNNALTDSLRFENNLFSGMNVNLDATMPATIPTWFAANNNTTTTNNAATLMVSPYNFTSGDYRLVGASVAATGASSVTSSAFFAFPPRRLFAFLTSFLPPL